MARRVHCSSASLMISVLSGSSSAAPWLASPAGCAVLCCAELRVIMRRFLGSVTSDVDVAFPVDAAGTTVESSGGDEEDGSAGRFVSLASFASFSFSPADTFVVDVGDATQEDIEKVFSLYDRVRNEHRTTCNMLSLMRIFSIFTFPSNRTIMDRSRTKSCAVS